MRQQQSVLDSVTQEVARLGGSLPQSDRTKLTEYLDAIRGVERRIQIAEEQGNQQVPLINHPVGIPADWETHVKLMFDLQVLAYQTDLTRVITMMLGHEHSGMTYPQIGVPDAHHPISHHQREPEKLAKVAKINAYHVKMFAYLLEKLRATPDGDGTLLDHMTLIYGAGIADSNSHAPVNIPFILAGGGAGNLKGGRHTHFKDMPLANLHLTLLDQLGVRIDKIGDSTGRVDPQTLFVELRRCDSISRAWCWVWRMAAAVSRRSSRFAADTGREKPGRRVGARAAEAARRREGGARRRHDCAALGRGPRQSRHRRCVDSRRRAA